MKLATLPVSAKPSAMAYSSLRSPASPVVNTSPVATRLRFRDGYKYALLALPGVNARYSAPKLVQLGEGRAATVWLPVRVSEAWSYGRSSVLDHALGLGRPTGQLWLR